MKREVEYFMENAVESNSLITERAIEHHLKEALTLLGFDLSIPDNTDTPRRIAKMWARETTKNLDPYRINDLNAKMTLFDNPHPENQNMILVRDIPFSSLCSHHFMPFFGKATIAYIPNDKIIGLSKIPRIVEFFSKMPQVQENLTAEIAQYLYDVTGAYYVGVMLYDTTHTCMSCRGVELPSSTETVYQIAQFSEEKFSDLFYKGCYR